jgi:hypothetical protein
MLGYLYQILQAIGEVIYELLYGPIQKGEK